MAGPGVVEGGQHEAGGGYLGGGRMPLGTEVINWKGQRAMATFGSL